MMVAERVRFPLIALNFKHMTTATNQQIMIEFREWVSDIRRQSYPVMALGKSVTQATSYMLHRYSKKELIDAVMQDNSILTFGMEKTWSNAIKKGKL
jgi:hypothetical protein